MRRKNVGPVCVYAEQPPPLIFSPTKRAPLTEPGVPSRLGSNGENGSEAIVDDDTTGSDGNWILKAGLLAASSSTNFFNTVFKESSSTGPETMTDRLDDSEEPEIGDKRPMPDKALLDRPATRQRSTHSAEYVLPSRKVADTLMDHFFRHAYIQWVDRLKFMRWYESLWTGEDRPGVDVVDEQINFANLNIIFALVYQSEPEELVENQAQLAQTYFLRAQKLLQLCLLDLNHLDLLWALLLLAQWFQSVNNVRGCTALVGLCILIARNLGLHRPERINKLPSQYRREVARRAWQACILMDRITAMISGQPLQISQDIAKKATLFVAIDDEYLSTNISTSTSIVTGFQPPEKPSNVSFFLAFCKLHLILGDVLDHQEYVRHDDRSVVDINHVIEIDSKLDAFCKALPPHLSIYDTRAKTYNQKRITAYTGPTVHLHARFLHIRIMLYRIFFLHGAERLKHPESPPSRSGSFADAVTHQGILTCVRTAQQILDLIGTRLLADDRGPRIVPQWWHTVTYVYTAATILIAAHIFPEVVEEITATSLMGSIQMGLQVLNHHTRYGESARRCKNALTVLCDRHIVNRPKNVTSAGQQQQQQPPNPVTSAKISPVLRNESPNTQIDVAEISADFGWEFTSPSDLFQGEGMESLLFFNTNLWGQEVNEWL